MQLKDVLEIREDIIVRVGDKYYCNQGMYYCNQGMYCEIGSSFRLKVGKELIKLVNFIPALKLLGLCDAKVVNLESYVESSFVTTAFGVLLVEVEERVVS